jgi:hypothetical protein
MKWQIQATASRLQLLFQRNHTGIHAMNIKSKINEAAGERLP